MRTSHIKKAFRILNFKPLATFIVLYTWLYISINYITDRNKLKIGVVFLKFYKIYIIFKERLHKEKLLDSEKVRDLVVRIESRMRGDLPMECNKIEIDNIPSYNLNNALVSIVIPTKNRFDDLLEPCLDSIISKSTYNNYEIVIVDNGSDQYNKRWIYNYMNNHADYIIRSLDYDTDEYNYAAIHNYAIPKCAGEYVIMLNNDTEVIEPTWIEQLVGPMIDSQFGIVGAKLLYRDHHIQHCGVVYNEKVKSFYHIHCGECDQIEDSNEYKIFPAVTGACIAFEKQMFINLGGMDENLAVAYNDIDLCMKVRKHGHRILYSPYARLYHYESKSRGYDTTFEKQMIEYVERLYFLQKWGDFVNVSC